MGTGTHSLHLDTCAQGQPVIPGPRGNKFAWPETLLTVNRHSKPLAGSTNKPAVEPLTPGRGGLGTHGAPSSTHLQLIPFLYLTPSPLLSASPVCLHVPRERHGGGLFCLAAAAAASGLRWRGAAACPASARRCRAPRRGQERGGGGDIAYDDGRGWTTKRTRKSWV